MDIWDACADQLQIGPVSGTAIRVVESQEQIATNALVDNLAEQEQLETLLDAAKPPAPPETAKLHYLLATPFRYPPLRHGSRFGSRNEPSLFYGALELRTALAETAYYRLLFWYGMTEAPPHSLVTAHTVFGFRYASKRGLRLQHEPFAQYRPQIANPASYQDTQKLGQHMRQAGVQVFEYPSARDQETGINVALFTAKALSKPRPTYQQAWLCETDATQVRFYSAEETSFLFETGSFLVDGQLPAPAV